MKLFSFFLVVGGVATASWISQSPLNAGTKSHQIPGENTLMFCSDPEDYILTIDTMDLSPNPPVPGQNLTIRTIGKLSDTVDTGSKVHITVKWSIITIIDKVFDICENSGMVDKECPLREGALDITKEVVIPKAVPPGKYTVTAEAFTKDQADGGKRITCMEGDIRF